MIVLLALWAMFALFGMWIASVKGRETGEGFLLGFLFGPLGCLIEAVLPNQLAAASPPVHVVTITPEQAAQAAQDEAARRQRQQAIEAAEAACRAKLDAEHDARLEESMRQQAEFQANLNAALTRTWAWIDRVILRFGWFRALPEVVQPILLGMAFALPAVVVIVVLVRPVESAANSGTNPVPVASASASAPVAKQVDPDQQFEPDQPALSIPADHATQGDGLADSPPLARQGSPEQPAIPPASASEQPFADPLIQRLPVPSVQRPETTPRGLLPGHRQGPLSRDQE